VKVQAQFSMSYQNDRFESDLTFQIIDQETLYSFPDESLYHPINEKFMEAMKETEEQAKKFLEMYYQQSARSLYSNLHRICKIKEL